MSRLFYLENDAGSRFALNGERGVWLVDVEGLGLDVKNACADIGSGFFTAMKSADAQQSIPGTLYFKGFNHKTVYEEFIDFVAVSSSMYLVYKPIDTEFKREIMLNYISKGESSPILLKTSVSFLALSPWYKNTPLTLGFANPQTQDYFQWGMSAWGDARWAASTEGNYSAAINPRGHKPAALWIKFTGAITNPIFTLQGASGKIYGRCKITGTFTSGSIILDTRYGKSEVKHVEGETETDLLSAIDTTTEPFFRVPLSESCTLTISGADISGSCEAKIYSYYGSV